MESFSLGYSPCPNDTFIFYGLVHGRIEGAPVCRELLEDIATLNSMALEGRLDVTKISFHAFAHLRVRYCLLHSGGALGRGCGPLVVAREGMAPDELRGKRVAIPGKLTTAALLLRLFDPDIEELIVMSFDEIMPAAERGEVDAGLIIHESRFTYPRHGLVKVIDLGEWWEESTGHPIPLGGILARRALGAELIGRIDRALRESVEFAYAHPEEVRGYIREHAQEMEDEVMRAHIDLYVNEYTLDYGAAGAAAIVDLLERAVSAGIVPESGMPLFVENA
ncbi:MAG: 1,4-dihydroxy-6-naphthoate synthase [Gemmatimonadetes bacterium]|jgi:1,4-dihydroxy-6-naphthoate synthase|nr:1,4-dihydroxy-6-naphthoate synthase [Gemmatimonadota bacterium]